MITVKKYLASTASGETAFGLDIHAGARLVGVRAEGGSYYIYAYVNDANANESRTFLSIPTGTAITLTTSPAFVGSAHVDPGPTYHFFEIL